MLIPMRAETAQPEQTHQLLDDDGIVFEPKIDGERLLVDIVDGKPTSYTKEGRITFLPGPVRDALSTITGTVTLDGELVAGRYALFDLVEAVSWDIRRTLLEATYAQLWTDTDVIRLVPVARGHDAKIDMIDRIVTGLGEGIMAKYTDSLYVHGARSTQWLKIKRTHTIDCVVAWIGTEKKNMGVGLYDEHGVFHQHSPNGQPWEITRLTGDGPRAKPGDVVEVRVLYVTDDDRLYQPTLPMIRTDKSPESCLLSQFDDARTNRHLILEMT